MKTHYARLCGAALLALSFYACRKDPLPVPEVLPAAGAVTERSDVHTGPRHPECKTETVRVMNLLQQQANALCQPQQYCVACMYDGIVTYVTMIARPTGPGCPTLARPVSEQ